MTASLQWFARRPLLLAVLLILLCALVAESPFLLTGRVPVAQDNLHLFYPLNHLTGRLLRGGNLPVWNVHQMAGMPLMGDPESGWGSLTSMFCFTVLSLARAAGVMLALHLALAGAGTLLFMRSAGTGISGSTLAALAYMVGAPLLAPRVDLAYGNLSYIGALSWLPWMLLGVNLAVRLGGRMRLACWALTAFAASQELSVWLGQGAYYALGTTATYLVFQTLFGDAARKQTMPRRIAGLALHSIALSALTLAVSAWSLFPRLEFLQASNLRGGYGAAEQQFAGGAEPSILGALVEFGGGYIGAGVVLLALAAPWLRPRREQWLYLGIAMLTYLVSLEWIVDTARQHPPLRAVYGWIPGVVQLHLHYPERVAFVYVFFLCALAGTGLDALLAATGRRRIVLPTAAGAVAGSLFTLGRMSDSWAPEYVLPFLGLALASTVVLICWYRGLSKLWASRIIVALTAAELLSSVTFAHVTRVRLDNPSTYYGTEENSAAIALLRSAAGSSRFFGYDQRAVEEPFSAYRRRWPGPVLRELLVASQATVHGLEDVQGYNPMHLRVYDRLLAAANSSPQQNYRSAYVLPSGLDSPLLDMLNARYLLVRKGTALGPQYEPVRDPALDMDGLRLYENTRVSPRAWVVHRAVAQDDSEALRAIQNGLVNPRDTAVVARIPERLEARNGPEQVSITSYLPERIEVNVRLSSAGLLVLSELVYPAWKVKVDGQPQPVIQANGALRSVVVPSGEHTVTWYYDSTPTRVGFWISGTLGAGLVLWLLRLLLRPARL